MTPETPWTRLSIDVSKLSHIELRFFSDGKVTRFEIEEVPKRNDVLIRAANAHTEELGLEDFAETPAPAVARPPRPAPIAKSTSLYTTDFVLFWTRYPNRKNKGAALRAWKKLNPDTALKEKIFKAIEAQSTSKQWVKDGGEFIPHPATWLNGLCWEDDAASTDIEGDRMRANTKAHVSMMSAQEHFE